MGQGLGGTEALLRIYEEQLSDEVFCPGGGMEALIYVHQMLGTLSMGCFIRSGSPLAGQLPRLCGRQEEERISSAEIL